MAFEVMILKYINNEFQDLLNAFESCSDSAGHEVFYLRSNLTMYKSYMETEIWTHSQIVCSYSKLF